MKTFKEFCAEMLQPYERMPVGSTWNDNEWNPRPFVMIMPQIANALTELTGEKWEDSYSGGGIIGYFRRAADKPTKSGFTITYMKDGEVSITYKSGKKSIIIGWPTKMTVRVVDFMQPSKTTLVNLDPKDIAKRMASLIQ